MFPYIPNTPDDEKQMLESIGIDSVDRLFDDIPDNIKLGRRLNLEKPLSELEIMGRMNNLAMQNKSATCMACFLGAGAYDHYIPSIVDNLTSRQEFATAYTPYQPEISQGTVRVIFEYQTMIADLTGLDVANASLYDGQTACPEAAIMALASVKKSNTILVSKAVSPESRQVLNTYMKFRDVNVVEVDLKDGVTDVEHLASLMTKEVAGFIVQSPNFLGLIEDVEAIEKVVHSTKAKLILSTDPIALGILKKPSEMGVDIVIGEGQALGNYLSYGGPYLGFIAADKKLARKMPGRIVGQSEDPDGKRAFVLTLQAREQHIRRYKATSNICSNQGLIAVRATIYMATLGKQGLREVAMQCAQKSHYAYQQLIESGKAKPLFDKPFFKEFPVQLNRDVDAVNADLIEENILGGYNLSKDYPEFENAMLLCVTEKRTKAEIDKLVEVIK